MMKDKWTTLAKRYLNQQNGLAVNSFQCRWNGGRCCYEVYVGVESGTEGSVLRMMDEVVDRFAPSNIVDDNINFYVESDLCLMSGERYDGKTYDERSHVIAYKN